MTLQYKNLVKYCKDEFEYIIINNGIDKNTVDEISKFCKKNLIKEVKTHNLHPNNRKHKGLANDHQIPLKFIYEDYIKKERDIINVVIDHDVFPFIDFRFTDMIGDADLCGIYLENGTPYISSYITVINKNIDISYANVIVGHNMDSGIWTIPLVKRSKVRWLPHTCSSELEVDYIFKKSPKELVEKYRDCGFQFIDSCLIHYWQGSEWNNTNKKYHERKWKFVSDFLINPQKYNITLDKNVQYEHAIIDKWIRPNKYPLNK